MSEGLGFQKRLKNTAKGNKQSGTINERIF